MEALGTVVPSTPLKAATVKLPAHLLVATAALAAAAIYLWTAPEGFAAWWGYGTLSLAAALSQGLFAVLLLRWPARPLMRAGVAGNLALVSLFALGRTPAPHADGWILPDTLGTAAAIIQISLLMALLILANDLAASRRYIVPGILQALGAGLVLHAVTAAGHGLLPDGASQWASGPLQYVPLSILAVWLATPVARALLEWFGLRDGLTGRIGWALSAAGVFAALSLHMNNLVPGYPGAALVLGASFLVLLCLATARGAPWEKTDRLNLRRPRALVVLAGAVAGFLALAGPADVGTLFSPQEAEAQAAPTCSSEVYDRSYAVAAINVQVPYNRWGQRDPNGQVFVLQGDKEAVRNWSTPLAANPQEDPAGNRRLRPRPLVLRANAGECVKVVFTNELRQAGGDGLPIDPRASIRVFGPSYGVQTSDGSSTGYNQDTTVGRNQSITYLWRAPRQEGTYTFRDGGAPAGSEGDGGSSAHGLYGALVVEPAGSTYRDPETGDPLYAGADGQPDAQAPLDYHRISKHSGDPYVDADILPGSQAKAFRETVQISQDELPGAVGFAFNYGAEPGSRRVATDPAGAGRNGQLVPDGIGEETSLSSWGYGDPSLVKLASGLGPWRPTPGDTNVEDCGLQQRPGGSCYVSNVTHAYPNDPTKVRFVHAGVKETHVFHMHAHQWRSEPSDGRSQIIDSQTFGPGEAFTASLIGGAGSKPGTVGDSIFHCHLYPHFADGFWALFRVHDVMEDGTGALPDGTNVRALQPLPDRTAEEPPAPTADNPGFPRFIPGEFGWRAPQPPGGILEPDPTTPDPDDKREATRIVAGRPIPADKLALEQSVQTRDGNVPEPGAPFVDPCPTGAREVTYNVSVIQTDVVYNEAGWHDTQGRILVLDKDVEDVLAGREEPEPLFIRVNAGDCVNFNLTNRLPNWFGDDAFVRLAQTNMMGGHIHLVKFDVLGSDGSSNGWNYQQAAFSKEQAEFNDRVLTNTLQPGEGCDNDGCRVADPAPGTWDPSVESGPDTIGQTISERWHADTELRTVFTHDHHFPALDQNRGQFGALLVEPAGTNFRNPTTGEFYQPGSGNVPGARQCGASCEGSATGTRMDVIGPNPNDDFREFGLAVQDFVSLTKQGGDPRLAADTIEAPLVPEEFPKNDPGTVGINYKNAPLVLRREKNGRAVDPAYSFSSSVWGDPATPVFEAYSEDRIRMRVIQGSQEEQHVFNVHGIRWRDEPDNPNSPLIGAKPIGISEAFNFEVPRLTCAPDDRACAGDYLYSTTSTDGLYGGAWGIMRSRGERVPSLLPLPDNANPNEPTTPSTPFASQPGTGSGLSPPPANLPGNPCPVDAPTKRFEVVAMEKRLEYNGEGDHDPYGLLYALAGDEAAIRSGAKKPEPLVLRANEGDCVEVRLTNKLTESFLRHTGAGVDANGDPDPQGGDPALATEPPEGTPAGLRVSLHPQLVRYDVRGSDGATVGFNRDQTVAPGDSRLYRWYADEVGPGELGTINLTEFGDVRGHRHHGLFAALNIEPRGATYHDPATGSPVRSGASADIRVPGPNNDFREFSVFFQDGLNLRDVTGALIEDPVAHPPLPGEPAEPLDAEDQGEKGFSYAGAPFHHRLGGRRPIEIGNPDGRAMADLYSSVVHGDPDTPIFRAYSDDRVRLRVLQGSDKPRQHAFHLSGHSWKRQPDDPASETIGTQGGISVGRAFEVRLTDAGSPGDHRYGCAVGFHHLSGGLWGLMRVYQRPDAVSALFPTGIGPVDNPHLGGHPLLPLEISTRATALSLSARPETVRPGATSTLSGRLTLFGRALAGRPVTLWRRPSRTGSFVQAGPPKTTSPTGNISFLVRPSRSTLYQVRFAGAPDAGLGASNSPARLVRVRP